MSVPANGRTFDGRGDLGREVVRALLQPLADFPPDEAPDGDLLAEVGADGGPDLLDGLGRPRVGVQDSLLVKQTDLGEPLVELPLDDLREAVGGDRGRTGRLREDLALLR